MVVPIAAGTFTRVGPHGAPTPVTPARTSAGVHPRFSAVEAVHWASQDPHAALVPIVHG